MNVSGGQAILSLSRWAFVVENVVLSSAYDRLRPSSLDDLQRVRGRLARCLSGLESMEAGAAIAAGISSSDPKEIAQGCSHLRRNLEGPDFSLALAIAPAMPSALVHDLDWQADKFRRIVSGKRSPMSPSTKQIAQVADLIQEGTIPLSRILRVMRARIPLLNEGAQRAIQSAHIFDSDTLEDLFSGRLEEIGLPTYSREGGPKSAAMAGLVQAFFNIINLADAPSDKIPYALREEAWSFFDFLEHPLLKLAFAVYVGTELLIQRLDGPAFVGDGFLASRRPGWIWAGKQRSVEIDVKG